MVADVTWRARAAVERRLYTTPGLSWNRQTLQGRPFFYFAYGAKLVSEVIVDTLTGEWKLLRADLLHDAGRPLNPALDIGWSKARSSRAWAG